MAAHELIETEYAAPTGLRQVQRLALVIGILGAVLMALGWLTDGEQFFRSYLFGYMFWTMVSVGCLGILMIQHLSGGVWGATLRRFLEAGAFLIPVMGILSLPLILFGMSDVYPWTHPEVVAESEVVAAKAAYLDVNFFRIRIVIYFVVWTLLALLLNNWSRAHDRSGDPRLRSRLTGISGPGMIVFAITVTLAAVDLVMSLEPEWFSTIYGGLIGIAMIISAFSLMIILLYLIAVRGPLRTVLSEEHFHDLGKLLLAFTILWTYIHFSQFLISYAGNLPVEAGYYNRRLHGGWEYVGLALLLFQFILPFLLLLSRYVTRSGRALARVAGLVFTMQVVNLFWVMMPAFREGKFGIHWMDIVAPLAVGGIWLALFIFRLNTRPLLPLHVLPLRHPRQHTELEHA